MQLSDVRFIVIESPLRLEVDGNCFSLSPEEDADAVVQPLRELVGRTVDIATADESGTLQVIFEGGARLTVEADEMYEAWNVSGPGGALVVCTPGGELAIWQSQSNADDH